MSETIMKCYLLDEKETNTFDSVITVLTNDNSIVSLYAYGTKKILSKNSRNLIYGDLLEIEFFRSRSKNSLSKLKKIKSINNSKPINYWDFGLLLVNTFIIENNKYFKFKEYENYINIISNLDTDESLIFSLFKIIVWSGTLINLRCCSICGDNKIKTISIGKMGYLCAKCAHSLNEYIHDTDFNKIFIDLKNENVDTLKDFKFKNQLINFLKSYIDKNVGFKIYNHLGVK